MKDIHYVACNMVAATTQAVIYLLKKGHRSIGFINGPETLLASRERKEGYIQAMTKSRLKFDPSFIINSNLTQEGTYHAMEALFAIKRKPTAIVTFNDYVALDAIQYSLKKNIKVNEEISFISFANLAISKYTAYPPLASVEQFPYLQGQKATEILIDLISQNKNDLTQNSYHQVTIDANLVLHDNIQNERAAFLK